MKDKFTLADFKYNEAIELPKFKDQLDRLLGREQYDLILDYHHIPSENLLDFTIKAINEGNAILIQREYCGYMVILWKDTQTN